ncbi:MAG: hypothetical protein PSV16_02105 [Flavobacterium sp.]|nr:hypothetical protein [Flavobacterium sp.]
MKKVILIVAVLLVAIVGLTSYNGKEKVKNNGGTKLIAQINTGGETGVGSGGTTINPGGGDKKKLD